MLVRGKTGMRWRRKRGTLKPAVLNEALAANAANFKVTIPAGKRMLEKLEPYMYRFAKGRNLQTFASYLSKAMRAVGKADYTFFLHHEMQKEHPLSKLLEVPYKYAVTKGTAEVTIPLKDDPVKKHNLLVTEYFFELILLHGDPIKKSALRTEADASPIYLFSKAYKGNCTLSVEVTERRPYIILLKVGCNEGNQPAMHSKHYGMRVVGVG